MEPPDMERGMTLDSLPVPYFQDDSVTLYQGNCADVLRQMPPESVQCCVTSPPYWGLRDYGCDGQLGLEKTPEEYVSNLVSIFRELRRVLRDDGSLWLNLGDSYNGSGHKDIHVNSPKQMTNRGGTSQRGTTIDTLKPKDLVGIPWRVAFALQADGWWLRQDIVWAKPNPMPESVTDRCTKSHEYIFLLTKNARYYMDMEAIKEPSTGQNGQAANFQRETKDHLLPGQSAIQHRLDRDATQDTGTRNRRSVWTVSTQPYKGAHFATFPPDLIRPCILAGTSEKGCCSKCGKPWERVAEKSRTYESGSGKAGNKPEGKGTQDAQRDGTLEDDIRAGPCVQSKTLGWQPQCTCDGIDRRIVASPTGERSGDDPSMETGRAGMNRPRGDNEGQRPITRYEQAQYAIQLKNSEHRSQMETESGNAFAHYLRTDGSGARPIPHNLLTVWIGRGWLQPIIVPEPKAKASDVVPCVVLDPFAGSGTTGEVAKGEGRKAVLIELKSDYCELARKRIQETCARMQL